jgi:hypothetical protein
MTMRRLALTFALFAGLTGTAQAQQDLPPQLKADTAFSLTGVSDFDYRSVIAVDDAKGAATDTTLGRSYAVGRTQNLAGDTDLAIVARRADGALDTTFAGDGTFQLDVTPGNDDAGVALAVRPDHSLLVLGATDVSPTASPDVDVALVPVAVDGTAGAPVVFDAGSAADAPAALAIDGDTIAVTGSVDGATSEDTFVALRHADLSAKALRVFDRGGATIDDRGVGIAFGGAGLGVLIGIDRPLGAATALHQLDPALQDAGDAEIAAPGASDVDGHGLTAFGGALWATGTATSSGDRDAWLARLAGGALETRRFDIRGTEFPATQAVNTDGRSITAVPGTPDTIVLGGATETDRGKEWSFAAFNELDGPVSALQMAELVIPIAGQGGAEGVAGASLGAAGGVVSAAGTLEDFEPARGGTHGLSIGQARVLVDSERRCDLALAILSPVELVLRGNRTGVATVRVTNNGTRRCSGVVSLPAPYAMVWDGSVGTLAPGASFTRAVEIGYGAAYPPDDLLALTLTAPDDVSLGDNVARVRVTFAFCDLQLELAEQPAVLGTEGARRFAFTLRNRGTAACPASQVVAALPGVRSGTSSPVSIGAGRQMTDELEVGVVKGTKSGTRPLLAFQAQSPEDISIANNGVLAAPMIVRPGDTNLRKPSARSFRGTASAGAAKGVSKKTLAVKRVEVAVLRSGKGCRWLSSRAGDLRTVDAGAGGKCDEPVWVAARGTKAWRLRLAKRLPKGRYTVFSRAVLANGLPEGRFSTRDRNQVRFRVR